MLLSYPSLIAIVHYRIAHVLYIGGSRIVARSIAEVAHRETGIDIHPGATIGPGLFIDHGTGVIIGETAVIGADVHIHQGVTIGGIGQARGARRHPRIGGLCRHLSRRRASRPDRDRRGDDPRGEHGPPPGRAGNEYRPCAEPGDYAASLTDLTRSESGTGATSSIDTEDELTGTTLRRICIAALALGHGRRQDRRRAPTQKAAEAHLRFMYTPEAQDIEARNFYQSRDPAVAGDMNFSPSRSRCS